jgi:hypothetical protein
MTSQLLELLQGLPISAILKAQIELEASKTEAEAAESRRLAARVTELTRELTEAKAANLVLGADASQQELRLAEAAKQTEDLRKSVEERDQVIRELTNRLHGLLPDGSKLQPAPEAVLIAIQRHEGESHRVLYQRYLVPSYPLGLWTITDLEYELERLRVLGLATGTHLTQRGREYLKLGTTALVPPQLLQGGDDGATDPDRTARDRPGHGHADRGAG